MEGVREIGALTLVVRASLNGIWEKTSKLKICMALGVAE